MLQIIGCIKTCWRQENSSWFVNYTWIMWQKYNWLISFVYGWCEFQLHTIRETWDSREIYTERQAVGVVLCKLCLVENSWSLYKYFLLPCPLTLGFSKLKLSFQTKKSCPLWTIRYKEILILEFYYNSFCSLKSVRYWEVSAIQDVHKNVATIEVDQTEYRFQKYSLPPSFTASFYIIL